MATTLEVKPEAATLTNDEIQRYSRHLIMPEVGMEGQLKLKAARVLCIGAGGLGSPLAFIWARPAWAPSGSWTSMWWTTPTCSARSFTPPPTWGARSWIPPPRS